MLIVKTIHGAGSHVESVDGMMVISNCNVTVEDNLVEQLNDIKMISSIIKLPNKTIYTNKTGKFTQVTETKKYEQDEEYYMNEGMVIYIKGKPMIMIHPDNLESNIEYLETGNMKFGWKMMLDRVNNVDEK